MLIIESFRLHLWITHIPDYHGSYQLSIVTSLLSDDIQLECSIQAKYLFRVALPMVSLAKYQDGNSMSHWQVVREDLFHVTHSMRTIQNPLSYRFTNPCFPHYCASRKNRMRGKMKYHTFFWLIYLKWSQSGHLKTWFACVVIMKKSIFQSLCWFRVHTLICMCWCLRIPFPEL